jgi:hypothetical protein
MKKKNAKKGASSTTSKKDKVKEEPAAKADDPKPDDESAAVEEAPAAEETEATELSAPVPTSASTESKMRSASFRAASMSGGGPLSPTSSGFPLGEGETAADIYRKQVARIEDLEKENKRLAKEATDSDKRWQKAEETLADLREADDGSGSKKSSGSDAKVEKLVCLSLQSVPRRRAVH